MTEALKAVVEHFGLDARETQKVYADAMHESLTKSTGLDLGPKLFEEET